MQLHHLPYRSYGHAAARNVALSGKMKGNINGSLPRSSKKIFDNNTNVHEKGVLSRIQYEPRRKLKSPMFETLVFLPFNRKNLLCSPLLSAKIMCPPNFQELPWW